MKKFLLGFIVGAVCLYWIAGIKKVTMVFMTADGKYLDIQKESWATEYIQSKYERETRSAETGELCEIPLGSTIAAHGERFQFYEPDWTRIYSTKKEYPVESEPK